MRLTLTLHDRILRHLRRAGRLYDPEHPEAREAVDAEPDADRRRKGFATADPRP